MYLIDRPVGITTLRAAGAAVSAVGVDEVRAGLLAGPTAALDIATAQFSDSRANPRGGALEGGLSADSDDSPLGSAWGLFWFVVRAKGMTEGELSDARAEVSSGKKGSDIK